MATLFGSQFEALAGNPFGSKTVNPVFTTDGSTDPSGSPLSGDTVSGDFNLEVFVGTLASAPTIASGYQGLAVLSPSGTTIDLVSGSYFVRDNGSGGSTMNADGSDQFIRGASGDTLNVNGSFDSVNGLGDTVNVNGALDTATGLFDDTVNVNSAFNVISDSGGSVINITANSNEVIFGGNDTIGVTGDFNEFAGAGGDATGTNSLTINGDDNAVTGLSGTDSVIVTGSFDTVTGQGSGTLTSTGDNDSMSADSGSLTVNGDFDTVTGGNTITAGGAHDVITANTGVHNLMLIANGDFDSVTVTNNLAGVNAATANGSHDSITADEADTITAFTANGNFDTISGNIAPIVAGGSNDAIHILQDALDITGGGNDTIYVDELDTSADNTTVTGFSQASGDRLHLPVFDPVTTALANSQQVNGGADTLITLQSGATILLKGVTSIDSSFFV